MTYDRTYWRMVSDTRLTETARYSDNDLAHRRNESEYKMRKRKLAASPHLELL